MREQPEDRCTLSAECDAPFETTIVGWAGGTGWVFDACWPCARRKVDEMCLVYDTEWQRNLSSEAVAS